MKISILGPPGAGKSTQAERLSELCGWIHLYPGMLLRREVDAETPLADRIKSHLDTGSIAPSEIVFYLIERELAQAHGDYIFDGFPRTMEQALELEFLLTSRDEKLDAVALLDIDEAEVFRRLLKRGRVDDTPELIEKRLEVFHSETDPVIRFYEQEGKMARISGCGTPDMVTERILSAVGCGGKEHQ